MNVVTSSCQVIVLRARNAVLRTRNCLTWCVLSAQVRKHDGQHASTPDWSVRGTTTSRSREDREQTRVAAYRARSIEQRKLEKGESSAVITLLSTLAFLSLITLRHSGVYALLLVLRAV